MCGLGSRCHERRAERIGDTHDAKTGTLPGRREALLDALDVAVRGAEDVTEFGPYPAKVLTVHDGDTLRLDIDQGFGTHQTALSARLYGVNAPELSTQAGKDARDFLVKLLPAGTEVRVISHGYDKYGGRYDATVTQNGVSVNDLLVSSGHAVKT